MVDVAGNGAPDQEVGVAGGPAGVGPGSLAPDFNLAGTGGHSYGLSDHRGEPVVLGSYSEDLNEFEALGATVLCLSPQDVASHEEFAAAQGLRLPLLSDPDKVV